MSVTAKFSVTLQASESRSADLESAGSSTTLNASTTFANGNGLNQADLVWSDERSLASAATEDIDVVGGLTNLFGAITPTKVKGLAFKTDVANTTSLTFSRPAANGVPWLGAASDALAALPPGGWFAMCVPSAAGLTVAAGTADLITVTNGSGATATYQVGLLLAT